MGDGCDLVYALIVERLERHVLVERQVAVAALAAGSKKVTVPTFEGERARLDADLFRDDTQRDPEQVALRQALGLR